MSLALTPLSFGLAVSPFVAATGGGSGPPSGSGIVPARPSDLPTPPLDPTEAPLESTLAVRLMAALPIARQRLLFPPQGGVSVRTSEGLIQFGAGMWINKWVAARYGAAGDDDLPQDQVHHRIPLYFIHDSDFAGPDVGLIPYDFLQYMAFLVKGARFTFVAGDPRQAERLKRYLDLTYLSDRSPDLTRRVGMEYSRRALAVPDLLAEIERGFETPPPEELRRVVSFDEGGGYRIGNVEVRRLGDQRYEVIDQGTSLGVIDLKRYPPRPFRQRLSAASMAKLAEVRRMAVEEGRPGLWPLGTSDGFDPRGSTSGFMIWNRGRVVLVDPPSHTVDYFRENQIPFDRIDGVIVTHGHTDHFNDAIPRLLREVPQTRFYTTPTIYALLLEQYELSLGRRDLENWEFVPVRPWRPIKINGMEYLFDYSFHNVPAVGFEIWLNDGLALYFSGDTLASFDVIDRLIQRGPGGEPPVMSLFRGLAVMRHSLYIYLSSLTERPPIILLDGGVPPTHLQPEETRRLIEEARERRGDLSRVLTFHLSTRRAKKAGVRKWREGHAGWIDLDVA